MGNGDSPLGPKLRIRLKAEDGIYQDEGSNKQKRRKRAVSFANRDAKSAMEESRAALLLNCFPSSVRKAEVVEVVNMRVDSSLEAKEDQLEALSDEFVDDEEVIETLDKLETEAKKLISNSAGYKSGRSKLRRAKEEYVKSSQMLSDQETSSAVTVGENEDEHNHYNDHHTRSINTSGSASSSSPVGYSGISQVGHTPVFLPPQPIPIAPNVVQQPPRTYANSLLLSKEKFSTRAYYPYDPNFNSAYLVQVKPMPESMAQMYQIKDPSTETQNERPEDTDLEDLTKEISIELPSCSDWFDMDKVHPIEIEMLEPIFRSEIKETSPQDKGGSDGKENLDSMKSLIDDTRLLEYKALRNEIISLYRKTPRQYLTVTECRRRIPYTGDISVLLQLHVYLEFWGLINFQADPKTFPPKTRKLMDYKMKDLASWPKNNSKYDVTPISRIDENTINNPFATSLVAQCISCNKPCMYCYYILRAGVVQGVSMAALDRCVWCVRCYSEGRFPSILHGGHFFKVDLPVTAAAKSPEDVMKAGPLGIATWTQEEVQRLIEGIELHGDDWDAVSHYVGNNRTPQECVAYFIQIPIEEPFMRNVNPSKHTKTSFPFMDVSNPLMTQIALVASIVNPVVAASAAKSALGKILEIEGFKEKSQDSQDYLKGETTGEHIDNLESSTKITQECIEKDIDTQSLSTKEDNRETANEITNENVTNPINNLFLPKFVPCISSAEWPSSALLGEKGVQEVCSIALESAAKRAKDLANWEENEILNLMPQLIDITLNRLELKLKQFKYLQSMVEEERQILEDRFEKIKSEHCDLKNKLNHAQLQLKAQQHQR
ncbi:SWIRM domain-containing protein [Cryptosporidium serpentis]